MLARLCLCRMCVPCCPSQAVHVFSDSALQTGLFFLLFYCAPALSYVVRRCQLEEHHHCELRGEYGCTSDVSVIAVVHMYTFPCYFICCCFALAYVLLTVCFYDMFLFLYFYVLIRVCFALV